MARFTIPDDALQVSANKLTFSYLDKKCAVYAHERDVVVVGDLKGFEILAPLKSNGGVRVQDVRLTVGTLQIDVRYGEPIHFLDLVKPEKPEG